MKKKERLDIQLVERGIFSSREKAKAAVMAGLVFVEGERHDKPGTKLEMSVDISVKGAVHPYVSRGGLKLEKAIKAFHLDLNEKVVMDIGASTGGFTDCALQNGANMVYAIDVGYGQLAWSLRQDERVIVMERTNFRHLKPQDLTGEPPNFSCIDVSFISLRIILPVLKSFLSPGSEVVALVKPQFEAGREQVGKKGVVRDRKVHQSVLEQMIAFAVEAGYQPEGLSYSPIQGGEGNIEFLLYLKKLPENETGTALEQTVIDHAVNEAHGHFES